LSPHNFKAGEPPLVGCLDDCLAYVIYSQLLPVSEAHFVPLQPETAPCCKNSSSTVKKYYCFEIPGSLTGTPKHVNKLVQKLSMFAAIACSCAIKFVITRQVLIIGVFLSIDGNNLCEFKICKHLNVKIVF
jgi:hypothetical protein